MKSSKAEIQAKYHKIPVIRLEDQKLTSFSGLLIFQVVFSRLRLKERLKKCFEHMRVSPIFGRHLVVLLLIVLLVIEFRRLREIDYYRDDPLVLRLMGLKRLPNAAYRVDWKGGGYDFELEPEPGHAFEIIILR